MPETSLPVEYLFTMTATTEAAALIEGGPQGTRRIVPVPGGTFDGPRLRGTIETPSGDWLTRRADGTARLDVRVTLKTEDGAYILMTYNGIVRIVEGRAVLRTAPLFEAGDGRYAWLNGVQAVGIGTGGQGTVSYQVYALL